MEVEKMKSSIKKIINKSKENILNLSSTLNNDNLEIDNFEISLEIKHILEDLRSILDYIAVDIHKKYCPFHKTKKIYFLYSNENENETNFVSKINKNFPGLYENYPEIYDILSSVQNFKDKSNWIVKLNDLANEVKHNELYINDIECKRNVTLKTDNSSLVVDGDVQVQKVDDRYCFFETGSVYVSGNQSAEFYSNGDIRIGDGVYNLDTKELNNIEKKETIRKEVISKKYNENILNILNLVLYKVDNLVCKLTEFI